MRGEVRVSLSLTKYSGSPPRVRGEETRLAEFAGAFRITPACAGRSCQNPQGGRQTRDHPRVCGEKGGGVRCGSSRPGSPPRVRGEVWHAVDGKLRLGITPACAGRSSRSSLSPDVFWDHPRVCGEKYTMPVLSQRGIGSPPRVRGEGSYSR